MSTVQVKPAPPKNEAFVEQQLARARRRIRVLDVLVAGLGLIIATFAYAVVLIASDRWLMLSASSRQLALTAFLLGAGTFAAIMLGRLVLQRINPYYAARKIEATIPNAKNSVVNWLDLREETLPPAIRGAVMNRAAKDLAQADLDSAVSARRGQWLAGTAALLLLTLMVQFFIGGNEFGSRFWRVFAPFGDAGLRTRTELVLVEPEAGDTTVALGHGVSFTVQVRGQVPNPRGPEAVRLLYRYHQTDPYEEQRFERESSSNRTWVTMIPGFQVHNGFWYKVAGGDAETPEYHVSVRSTPLLSSFDVTYRPRPYLNAPAIQTTDPNLEAMRGTEVTLIARANRVVREGRLEFIDAPQATPQVLPAGKTLRPNVNGKGATLAADKIADEPQAMKFQFILDRDGTYRIWFIADDNERNTEPTAYTIKVLRDAEPKVELKKPVKEVSLPVNGVLQVEGEAKDDFGVTGMTLKLRVAEDTPPEKTTALLFAKPYREGKKEQFRVGEGYANQIEHKDFVELEKVKPAVGEALKPGMVLECWLEATDACDYPPPGPNVGRSELCKITLTPPQDQKQKENQAKKAEQDQKKHEQKQDQQIKNENTKAENANQAKSPEERKQEEIENKLKEEEQRKKNEGQDKPDKRDASKGNGKPEGKPEAGADKNDKGEGKPEPKNDAGKPEAGKEKSEGKSGDEQKKNEGDAKGQGQQQDAKANDSQREKNQGECKNCKGGQAGGAGQGKDEGKKGPDQQKNEGSAKNGGKEGNSPQEAKGEGKRQAPGEQAGKPKGDGKGESEKGGGGQGQEVGAAKPEQPSPSKGEGKNGGTPNGTPTAAQGEGKSSKQAAKGGGTGQGQAKPTKDKGGPDNELAKGTPKGEGDTQPAGADEAATKQEIDEMTRKLQNAKREREEAKDKLEQLAREGTPRERKEAAKALKDAAGDKPADGGEKPTDPQVRELAEQMKDAKKLREEAEDKLKALGRNAESPENREAARKALEQAREGNDGKNPRDGKPDRQPGDGKPMDNGKNDNPGEPKSEPKAPMGDGKTAKGDGKTGEPKPGEPKNEPGQAKNPGKGATNAGEPGESGNRRDNTAGSSTGGTGEGAEADAEFRKKAGELQIENWKKMLTPEMLKENKWTKEQIDAFFKAKQEALKRQYESAREREKPTTPKGPGALRNQGPRAVQGSNPTSAPVQGSGPAQPPPALREGIKKFTEKLPTVEDK